MFDNMEWAWARKWAITSQHGGEFFFTLAFHTSTHQYIFFLQDFFFFPGQPSSWSFLSWGEGEGQTVQLFIQVVSTFQLSFYGDFKRHSQQSPKGEPLDNFQIKSLVSFQWMLNSLLSVLLPIVRVLLQCPLLLLLLLPLPLLFNWTVLESVQTSTANHLDDQDAQKSFDQQTAVKVSTWISDFGCQALRRVVVAVFLSDARDSIVIFQREASREPRVPSRFAKPWKSISGSWEQLLERDDRDQDGQRRGEDDCHQDEQRRGEEVCEGARREVHEEKRCAFAQTRNHRLPSIRSWITLTKCQVCTWTIMRRAQNLKLCQQWHSQSDLCNISQKLFALLPVDAFFGAEFEIYESYEISTATCSILILFWLRNSTICEAVLRFHPPSASRMTIKLYRMSLEKVPS